MQKVFSGQSIHPCAAFASGDFTIIYVVDEDECIAARCVVRTDKLPWCAGPVYGVDDVAIDMIVKRTPKESL